MLTGLRNGFLRVAAVVVLVGGCDPGTGRTPVYPVDGVVTVGGKPAAGAVVTFRLTTPPPGTPTFPIATSGPDGTFRLTTYEANDGAPAGEYVVTVVWPRPNGRKERDDDFTGDAPPDQLKGRYADPARSALRAQVAQEPTHLEPFRLD